MYDVFLMYQIIFNKTAGHRQLRSQLEDAFPQLKTLDGHFLLYRGQGASCSVRQLEKLKPGPQGYSVDWLRDHLAVGSAVLYIMPLGKELSLDPVENNQVQICITYLTQLPQYSTRSSIPTVTLFCR